MDLRRAPDRGKRGGKIGRATPRERCLSVLQSVGGGHGAVMVSGHGAAIERNIDSETGRPMLML